MQRGRKVVVVGKLLTASVVFILLHRVISGSNARQMIVQRVGEQAYGRLFQLASVAAVTWLGFAYAGARTPVTVAPLWTTMQAARDLQFVVQPLALLLIVTGFTTPNPGTFGQERVVDRPDSVRGILRVTRHPFLWGVTLFAAGHIVASPTVRGVILFGTLLFVALTGTLSIDAKRRRSLGAKWAAFAAQTSNIPFAAILMRRQTFRPLELGWGSIVGAIGLSIAMILAHPLLFASRAVP